MSSTLRISEGRGRSAQVIAALRQREQGLLSKVKHLAESGRAAVRHK